MICYRRDFACFLFVPMRFPIVQYADTLLLIHVDGQQILALLIIFSQSTGLDINYLKSSMIPINVVTEEKMDTNLALLWQLGIWFAGLKRKDVCDIK